MLILILADSDTLTDVSCISSVFGKNGFGLSGVDSTSQSVFYLELEGKHSLHVPSVLTASRHDGTRVTLYLHVHECVCV